MQVMPPLKICQRNSCLLLSLHSFFFKSKFVTMAKKNNNMLDLSTHLYESLLSFVSYLYSHPLQLAYLLFFSPYILQLISSFFPLLLSTSILLLLPLLSHEQRDQQQDSTAALLATLGNVFEWEFEADQIDAQPKNSESHSEKISFMPQTPDRMYEKHMTCSLARRAKQRSESLSRSQSENGRMLHDTDTVSKEIEWKRTLACKLSEEDKSFKEMDLLWEAYTQSQNEKRQMCIREEEEEDSDDVVGQVCCLQPFRLRTGKMAKISKAFKGIGIFHRSSSRRSRK